MVHKAIARAFGLVLLGGWFVQAAAQSPLQSLHKHVPAVVRDGKVVELGPLETDQQLTLVLHMPVRNPEELASLIRRQSDRSSRDYRQWLTAGQFTEKFGRTQDEYDRVVRFARNAGLKVTSQSPNRLLVAVQGSVENIQKAFRVNLRTFRHPKEPRAFFAPDREPSFALDLPISHVSGLNNYRFAKPLREHATGAVVNTTGLPVGTGSGPGQSFLGSDIRTAYNMGSNTGTGQTVALVEFAGYAASDITMFLTNTHQPASVPIVSIPVGGGTPNQWEDNDAESECAMDIEWVLAVAPGLKSLRVYVANEQFISTGNYYDGLVLSQIATDNIAKVVSSSWVWWPDDPATDEPYFQEMAAQGQTYLQSSGDYGVYIGSDAEDESYPGEDPYVTTVGGTTLTTAGPGGPWLSEVVWNDGDGGGQFARFPYGGGGGIANDGLSFPIPSWQLPVITPMNGGSTTVRNVPDIAMEADLDSYECTAGVCDTYGNGTSIATPRWAAFLALVNQQLVANGQPAGLGLVAPQLYAIGQSSSYGSSFHDIFQGNNDVYTGYPYFLAVPGYDLTTGWGSMNGEGLMFALAGTAVPSFGLSVAPASAVVVKGHQQPLAVLVNGGFGFSAPVTMSIAGAPQGMSATLSPNPATTTASLNVMTNPGEAIGMSTLTLSAASPGAVNLTGDISVPISVVEKPALSVSTSPSKVGLPINGPITSMITVSPSNASLTSAALQIAGVPDGVTANFTPNPVSFNDGQPATTLLTLTAGPAVAVGPLPLDITAVSQINNPTVAITGKTRLNVSVELHPFLISVSPAAIVLTAGSSVSVQVTVNNRKGYPYPVYLSPAYEPGGVNISFSNEPAQLQTTMTLTAATDAQPGSFPVPIVGSSGNSSSQTTLHVRLERSPHP